MALFGKKKEKTVDFTNHMMRQQERAESIRENMRQSRTPPASPTQESPSFSSGNNFGFLDSVASGSSQGQQSGYGQSSYNSSSYPTLGSTNYSPEDDADEKKRKLAKRLMDITDKIEEISNQLYHLQQRVELLEKKNNSERLGY